jgi:hypothetical protein
MARGWESKSVESQIEDAEIRTRKSEIPLTIEEQRRRSELALLELNRIRVVNEIARASHPRHRETLQAALKHLDDKITSLTPR